MTTITTDRQTWRPVALLALPPTRNKVQPYEVHDVRTGEMLGHITYEPRLTEWLAFLPGSHLWKAYAHTQHDVMAFMGWLDTITAAELADWPNVRPDVAAAYADENRHAANAFPGVRVVLSNGITVRVTDPAADGDTVTFTATLDGRWFTPHTAVPVDGTYHRTGPGRFTVTLPASTVVAIAPACPVCGAAPGQGCDAYTCTASEF